MGKIIFTNTLQVQNDSTPKIAQNQNFIKLGLIVSQSNIEQVSPIIHE